MLGQVCSNTMRFSPVAKNITKLLDIKSMKLMDNFSVFNPSPLTMKQLVEFGRTASEEDSYNFIKKEVPIRLANIMKEINLLPSTLLQMPSVVTLQEWYARSFMELCAFEGRPNDRDTLKEFVDTLKNIYLRHVNVVATMAVGVLELKESHAIDLHTENSIQYFLDRFYMSRISTRMLTNQHTMLFEAGEDVVKETRPNRIGVIDTNCQIKAVVNEAYSHAAFLCEEYYYFSPDINVKTHNAVDEGGEIEICYPPQHLYHILFELFKNAMRAVVESRKRQSEDLPAIDVLITMGASDVSIKISDQGGGIPRSINEHLFHYLYSTAPRPSLINPAKTPLAGYGYGLPLSRLYARYFHGDLHLNSYNGYGTDAVIYLKTDPQEAVELLPVFNKTSTKQYKASVATADWTDPASIMNKHYQPHYYSHVTKESESAIKSP